MQEERTINLNDDEWETNDGRTNNSTAEGEYKTIHRKVRYIE